jgi:hypothetical protein
MDHVAQNKKTALSWFSSENIDVGLLHGTNRPGADVE